MQPPSQLARAGSGLHNGVDAVDRKELGFQPAMSPDRLDGSVR